MRAAPVEGRLFAATWHTLTPTPLPLRRRGAKAGMDVFAIATHTAPLLRSGRGRSAAPGEGPAFRGNLTNPPPHPSPPSPRRGQSGRELLTMSTHPAHHIRLGPGTSQSPGAGLKPGWTFSR